MKKIAIERVMFYYSPYLYYVELSDGTMRVYGMYDTMPSAVHKFIQKRTPRGLLAGNEVIGRVWVR